MNEQAETRASTNELLTPELIAQIKGIQIRARNLVNNVFAGEYKSAFKGRGLEFEEVREYQPGDEIRTIDWNVTARMDKTFVKLYRDERELTVMFMVDVSASSHFGTIKKFKNEVSAEITALLAYTALQSNDKVGLIIFSDHVEKYLPPKKGRAHIWRLIREILTYKSQTRKTNLTVPLDFLNKVQSRKCVCFLISDFQGQDCEKELHYTSRHHELVALVISDPKEKELPRIGFIELEDAETGEAILVDTNLESLHKDLKRENQKQFEAQKKLFRSAGMDAISITTNESYLEPIIRYFRQKERRL